MAYKIVIGVAGRMASGKGSVAQFLIDKYDARRFRASDPLRAALDGFSVPQSRNNLQSLSTFLRVAYGEHVIIDTVARSIRESAVPIAAFDGMRRNIDVQTMRAFPNFKFLFVDVDQKVRYERYISRNENPGDAAMTYDEFIKEDTAEPEQQIENLKQHADFILDNSGGREEFERKIEDIIQQIIAAKVSPIR